MTQGALIIMAASISAVAAAAALRVAWNPPFRTYFDYVPICGLLGAFVSQRFLAWASQPRRGIACDVATIILAVMRVLVPPLPFLSGHTLLAVYASVTGGGSALRPIAVLVLALVIYDKLFWARGVGSMLAGALAAAVLASIRASASGRTGRPSSTCCRWRQR